VGEIVKFPNPLGIVEVDEDGMIFLEDGTMYKEDADGSIFLIKLGETNGVETDGYVCEENANP
jgi:hypothetical protein